MVPIVMLIHVSLLISPCRLEIKLFKADTYEVPITDGKIDIRNGTGTNTVLVDPKSGDMNLGTSSISVDKLEDGLKLNIGASELHHQKERFTRSR